MQLTHFSLNQGSQIAAEETGNMCDELLLQKDNGYRINKVLLCGKGNPSLCKYWQRIKLCASKIKDM